eukprot:544547_1
MQLVLGNWNKFNIYFQKNPQAIDYLYDQFNGHLHKFNHTETGQRWSDASKLINLLDRRHLSLYQTKKQTGITITPSKPTLNKERNKFNSGDGFTDKLADELKSKRDEFCRDRNIEVEPYWICCLDGIAVGENISYNPKDNSLHGQISEAYERVTAASIYDLLSGDGGMHAANNELQFRCIDARTGFAWPGPHYASVGEWTAEQIYSIMMDVQIIITTA